MTKVSFTALKGKKISHDVNEGKSAFQTIGIELYIYKKNEKRTPKINNKLY